MVRRTHELFSATLALAIQNFVPSLSIGPSILLFAGSVIGSTLPDIDMPEHNKHMRIYEVPFAKIYDWLTIHGGSYFGTEKYVKSFSYHRGIFHSLVPLFFYMFLFTIIGLFFNPEIQPYFFSLFWGVGLGILNHIFLDMFNIQGVQLFAPIYSKTYIFHHLPKITVGSSAENILAFILFFLLLAAFSLRVFGLAYIL